jgi:serine/threonine protein phosphatase 1
LTKTYVIADLHGRYDLLNLALTRIEASAPGTVVFLGDYIDRGPASRQIIERLIAGPSVGWNWVTLKGNHEELLVTY